MSEDVIKDIAEKGFVLLKRIHLVGIIMISLALGVANVALAYNMLNDHEERISELEETNKSKHDLLNEIKYNLKNFIEANGQKYIEIE